jgi:hypothetical protein
MDRIPNYNTIFVCARYPPRESKRGTMNEREKRRRRIRNGSKEKTLVNDDDDGLFP